MPYVSRGQGVFTKSRILISGLPKRGKTHSLFTFIYGPHDYSDPAQREAAVAYATERGKRMVIIECPGETGFKALHEDNEFVQSYYNEAVEATDMASLDWSEKAIADFNHLYKDVEQSRPDILVLDGMSALSEHLMNRVTEGEYLTGKDLRIDPMTGNVDSYRQARFYNQHHSVFGNYLSMCHVSPIPLIIVTCWEDFQAGKVEADKVGSIREERYLYPALPGKMAREILGKFDARVSARLEQSCCHKNCHYRDEHLDHYVWQFFDKNNVQGVGITGLRATDEMRRRPWIHQEARHLEALLNRRH